jgi:cation transport protein ChaC
VTGTSLWIFGYGSLVWRPAFPHLRAHPASIGGYARRFWQGSTDHRGLPGRPGRVVTLLPDGHESLGQDTSSRSARCWGTAYEVPSGDPEGVLASLDHRERGGYDRVDVEISLVDLPLPSGAQQAREPRSVAGVVYIAGPENENYLGAASTRAIARQIAAASGPSGANPEYVFELARSLRAMGAEDAHIFEVEAEVSRVLAEKPPRSQ